MSPTFLYTENFNVFLSIENFDEHFNLWEISTKFNFIQNFDRLLSL